MPSFTKALPRLGGALVPKPASSVTESGKSDLLMRFFESEWFDTWIALTYLYKSSSPGVQDYLCNRLYTLPEREVEKYLSQLTQLCMIRPNSSLERVIIDLCSRSLRIAIKTYWLLLAISQDNPHDLHVIALRDRCEQAALEGTWDLPFKDSRLPPLRISPSFVDMGLASPPRSPRGTLSVLSSTPSHVPSLLGAGERWGSPDRDAPGDTLSRAASPDCASPRPMSPDGFGSGVYSSVFMDTGVEGLLGYSAPQGVEAQVGARRGRDDHATPAPGPRRRASTSTDSGGREGAQAWLERTPASPGASGTSPDPASALSPPNSPRRRQTTFGATLDFIDALCTASSGLTAFPPEDREWALRQVLASINVQIEAASRKGVAVWFPMGTRARRVVRLAPRESNLLNSREKAPFTLYVEVLDEEVAAAEGGEGAGVGGEKLGCGPARNAGEPTPSRPPALQRMSSEPEDSLTGPGDEGSDSGGSSSAAALMAVRASSGTYLGAQLFGPARSEDAAGVDGAVEGEPSTAAPPSLSASASPRAGSTPGWAPGAGAPSPRSSPASEPSFGSTLGAAPGIGAGTWIGAAPPSAASSPLHAATARGATSGAGPRTPSTTFARPHPADLGTGLDRALAGLRGDAPLVRLHLDVLDDDPAPGSEDEDERGPSVLSSTASSLEGGCVAERSSASPAPGPLRCLRPAFGPSVHPEPSAAVAVVRARPASAPRGDAVSSPAVQASCGRSSWSCRLGFCRACAAAAAEGAVPDRGDAARDLAAPRRPHVRVRLSVHGGLDLSIKRTPPRHSRVPSHEALLRVARKHRLPPPVDAAADPASLASVPEQHCVRTSNGDGGVGGGPDAVSPRSRSASDPTERFAGSQTGAQTNPAAARPPARDPGAEERVYGEKWAARRARVRAQSPHGARPGWDLACVIVKAGDDCRQELLAMQLIDAFHDIFREARLPLTLHPYEVLVTSNRTALIELVPNAPSVHAVKGACPPGTSLRDHFLERYGAGTPELLAAQRNFVESMAAYSLVSYFLQIKDRHNGNILLDDAGHIVHIDFGFMLTNSPGGVNFESVPFKLTRELLEVMDSGPSGQASELFDYFKVLMIQGFLAVRRHADRILLLVEMMSSSACPCFKSRAAAVGGVRKRFALALPEPALVEMVLGLISDSLDAWRTRQYDYYQRVLNGVL
ncbi:PIK3 [Auxenochlorella protothecoides x Auxenochlorella symbiontica]